MQYDFTQDITWAHEADKQDVLSGYRDKFHIPTDPKTGEEMIYLCGNSLGLQPKAVRDTILAELDDWAALGVEGHVHARHPWMPYHEFLTEAMATVVGAKPIEVVVMNSLTVNLHLLMVSFYRPTERRNKIVIEYSAFPSDRYAMASQIAFHGYDPKQALIELKADAGETVTTESILDLLDREGDSIATLLIGNVNYYTGQAYDIGRITKKAHAMGCVVGFDLAHGAGNLHLRLHDDGPDFAAWCSYKYLNGGPGALSGIFVHERHAHDKTLPRFAGWWGHNKDSRFKMPRDFDPIPGAEGWQLSNPPILSMAAMRASLDIFHEVGMEKLTEKSRKLTGYLEFLIRAIPTDRLTVITPTNPDERGCQLSVQVEGGDRSIYEALGKRGVIADWREPDVIRVAPVPLYNRFEEMWHFVDKLKQSL